MRPPRWMSPLAVRRAVATGLLLLVVPSPAPAQEPSAALRDRVQQLVQRLGDPDAAARDRAAADLERLGPSALPLLPDPAGEADAERAQRLTRIRAALAAAAPELNLGAALVTIRGQGIRLTEALAQLQRQSGNTVVDLREQLGQELTNPALDLDLSEAPFFQALDTVCDQAGLAPSFYTGDGTIGLLSAAMNDAEDPATPPRDPAQRRVVYSGPFRIQWMETVLQRDFSTGAAGGNARLEIAWEPRLRPLLLDLKADALTIQDDRGTPIAPAVAAEAATIPLNTANPVAEVNLNMRAPDREARAIGLLKAAGSVTLPAGFHAFKFADLSKPGVATAEGARVELVSTTVDEFVWKVRLTIRYPGDGPGLDSYQEGLINNRLWLLKADGSRFEHNGGFSSLGADGSTQGFEYIFVDAPGKPADYGLVYEAPSRVETIPLEFEFRDVPLP